MQWRARSWTERLCGLIGLLADEERARSPPKSPLLLTPLGPDLLTPLGPDLNHFVSYRFRWNPAWLAGDVAVHTRERAELGHCTTPDRHRLLGSRGAPGLA